MCKPIPNVIKNEHNKQEVDPVLVKINYFSTILDLINLNLNNDAIGYEFTKDILELKSTNGIILRHIKMLIYLNVNSHNLF